MKYNENLLFRYVQNFSFLAAKFKKFVKENVVNEFEWFLVPYMLLEISSRFLEAQRFEKVMKNITK